MKNLKRNLLLFNLIFIVYGFVILFTNIIFQNYLINFDNSCENQTKEMMKSIELAEYSLIVLIGIGSFNLILALNGIYAVLTSDSCLLFCYGALLFLLFSVELITIAIIFATFKNFSEYLSNCGRDEEELISHGFCVCTYFLGTITISVGVIQIIAISNGCTFAEQLRIERILDKQSLISYIFEENICSENKRKQSLKDSKTYYF